MSTIDIEIKSARVIFVQLENREEERWRRPLPRLYVTMKWSERSSVEEQRLSFGFGYHHRKNLLGTCACYTQYEIFV